MRSPVNLRELRENDKRSGKYVSDRAGHEDNRTWANRVESKPIENLGLLEFIEYVEALGYKPGDILDSGLSPEIRPHVEILNSLSTTGREEALAALRMVARLDERARAVTEPPMNRGRATSARPDEPSVLHEIAIHDRRK